MAEKKLKKNTQKLSATPFTGTDWNKVADKAKKQKEKQRMMNAVSFMYHSAKDNIIGGKNIEQLKKNSDKRKKK